MFTALSVRATADRPHRPVRKKTGPVDVAALRTDLEALELTVDQLSRLARAGQQLAALRKDAHQRAHHAAAGRAPTAQDAPTADFGSPQHQQFGPEHGPGRAPGPGQ